MSTASRWTNATLFVATLAAFAAGLTPGCLETRDEIDNSEAGACATCHGDPARQGDKLRKAAPPRDLNGNAGDPSFPGVGAHEAHLTASETHAAVPCAECHLVPKATGDKGHADTALPAELVFASEGGIAKNGDRNPSYDPSTRRCSDTYCHRGSDATWTKPRSSAEACGSCHGLPPPPPHVQATTEQCVLCHGNVVGAQMQIIAPELHVNGEVNLQAATCSVCHGKSDREGDWLRKAAPPQDLAGNTDPTALGVGAHDVHLSGGNIGGPFPCSTCHVVPKDEKDVEAPGHADTPLPAEIVFSGIALAGGQTPTWDRETKKCSNVWCHGGNVAVSPATQEWTNPTDLGCTSCHGLPPPFPHPQMPDCVRCHADTINADLSFKDKTKHVNGTVDVQPKTGCSDCHGSATNAAPPVDLGGNTATTAKGVGAHQSHLKPNGPFRPVPCNECHVVPQKWDEAGHIDTLLPAELTFSGVATAWKAAPKYENGKCDNTYCHGAVTALAPPSGTLTVPEWTKVDGSQAACGNCHAFPPLAPHPAAPAGCDPCHKNLTGLTFNKPLTHVDGEVTFEVP